ncbi:MAG: TIGR00266 family protein [Pirellula sp.]
MEYSVLHGPVFSVLQVRMNQGETVVAQPNSMLSMSSGLQLSAAVGRKGARSAWLSGAKSLLGGESMFTAEFLAKRDAQVLTLAPSVQGDILCIDLKEQSGMYLTRGSFLASVGECHLQIKYGGVKGVMSKKGLFLLHASGSGTVFCETYGAIIEKELSDGETFLLDNRYAVAFSESIQYQLVKATDSVRDSILSGEGLINRYTGPGKVFYQTRAKAPVNILNYLFSSAF